MEAKARDDSWKEPFDFFKSPWWQDATKQLCADGWPSFVVPLNIAIRNAKESHDELQKRVAELEAEVKRLHDKYDFQLLVKRNEKMREALKRITRTRTRHPLIIEYREIARQALGEVET